MKTCRLACRKPPNNVGSKNKQSDQKQIKIYETKT